DNQKPGDLEADARSHERIILTPTPESSYALSVVTIPPPVSGQSVILFSLIMSKKLLIITAIAVMLVGATSAYGYWEAWSGWFNSGYLTLFGDARFEYTYGKVYLMTTPLVPSIRFSSPL
ncbi:MAG: hypothetical protein U9Q76_08810, partial [candidate division WOR-3 bacterium]|nr:hypothetical protein [candidate division WOR-3 bacterium]